MTTVLLAGVCVAWATPVPASWRGVVNCAASGGLSELPSTVGAVASKKRNPTKNKAARRRRPDRLGLRRARLEIEDIHHLMAAAPPAALPLVGLTSPWLWNLAEDQAAAAHCVDGCLTLHYALAEFGIRSHVEAGI